MLSGAELIYHSVWSRAEQWCTMMSEAEHGRGVPGVFVVEHIAINPFYVRNVLTFVDSKLKSVTC
jgi:hypothetical protein